MLITLGFAEGGQASRSNVPVLPRTDSFDTFLPPPAPTPTASGKPVIATGSPSPSATP